ncbi:MAG: hypothetical protein P8177_11385 [Gemmatimonadota bacterium]
MQTEPASPRARVTAPHRSPAWALPLLTTLLLAGCDADDPDIPAVVRSNVDEYDAPHQFDSGGSAQSIPGNPDGDAVIVVGFGATVVADGPLDGNALRIDDTEVRYRAATHAVPDRYQITWTGLRDNHASAPTRIRVEDGNGREAIALRFVGNDLSIQAGEQLPGPATFSTTQAHAVTLVIDMGGAKFARVTVEEDGNTLFETPQLDLIDSDFSRLNIVGFQSADGVSYFMRDLIGIAITD